MSLHLSAERHLRWLKARVLRLSRAMFLVCGGLIVFHAAGAEASGPDSFFRPGTAILMGEWHGTEEGPRAIAQMAIEARARGLSVAVLIEWSSDANDALDLLSGDLDADTAILCESLPEHFRWSRDGRVTPAMFELASQLAAMRRQSPGEATVRAFDAAPDAPWLDGDSMLSVRYRAKLHELRTALAHYDVVIANIGSAHPPRLQRRLAELPWAEPYSVILIRQRYRGGEAHTCGLDACEVRPIPEALFPPDDVQAAWSRIEDGSHPPYNYYANLPRTNASRPISQSGLCETTSR